MADWKRYLSSIYFDPKHPGSFAGPEKLYKVVKSEGEYKIGLPKITRWLQDQESYSLSKGVRRSFERSRVIVEGIDSQWDADLADMASLSESNDGFKYLLVAIDVFSRYAWCSPLKTKTGSEVANGLRKILKGGRRPKALRTDKGRELRNAEVRRYLSEIGVHHFFAQNTETKANYAERFIKTLKHKIYRYLFKTRKERYVDALPDLVYSYNNTVHQSLGRTPASVNESNESESRLEQYLLRRKKSSPTRVRGFKYKPGQTVRINQLRHAFDRQYSQKWSGELFKITSRFRRQGQPIYRLEDWSGDAITGTFYQTELQPVSVDADTEFSVEKVLRRRTRNKTKEALVRWLHWPKSYDSWIPESQLKDYKGGEATPTT